MEFKICYFARIREQLGLSDEILCVNDEEVTVAAVKKLLLGRGDSWGEVFESEKQVLCALNHEIVGVDHVVRDGDELAFFPPVTGG